MDYNASDRGQFDLGAPDGPTNLKLVMSNARTLFKPLHVTTVDGPIGKVYIESDGEYITRCSFDPIAGSRRNPPKVLQIAQLELEAYFDGKRKTFAGPIQTKGTRFQRMVWEQLRNIKHGKSTTYKQIGDAIGGKGMARTVGAACGKNQILLFIPCHRVLASNGLLTGYAGGLWRKKWLLEHEGVLQPDLFSEAD